MQILGMELCRQGPEEIMTVRFHSHVSTVMVSERKMKCLTAMICEMHC